MKVRVAKDEVYPVYSLLIYKDQGEYLYDFEVDLPEHIAEAVQGIQRAHEVIQVMLKAADPSSWRNANEERDSEERDSKGAYSSS